MLFSSCGEVIEVHIRKKAQFRGQAWIVFKSSRDAARAKAKLDGTLFYGKQLRLTPSSTKSDIIAKSDGTYVNRAQQKLNAINDQLAASLGDDDSNGAGVKRKQLGSIDGYDDASGIIKRQNLSNLPQLVISETPTAILLATNFPTTVTFDAMKTFFDAPAPLSLTPFIPQHIAPLLSTLKISAQQMAYKLVFSSPEDAASCVASKGRFKFDDEHRLKLVYINEPPKEEPKKDAQDENGDKPAVKSELSEDSVKKEQVDMNDEERPVKQEIQQPIDPNQNVSLEAGGQV